MSSASDYFNMGAAIAERNRMREEREEQLKEVSARNKAMRTVLPYLAQEAGIGEEMLAPFLQGSADESPRAEAAKFDALLKSLVQAGGLRQQIAAGDFANEAAALRNREAAAGAAANEEFQANLQRLLRDGEAGAGAPPRPEMLSGFGKGGDGGEDGDGAPPRPEFADDVARLAGSTAGRMARLGVRITPAMLAEFEKGDAERAALGRVGSVFTAADGSQYLWQNKGQVVPLSKGGAGSGRRAWSLIRGRGFSFMTRAGGNSGRCRSGGRRLIQ